MNIRSRATRKELAYPGVVKGKALVNFNDLQALPEEEVINFDIVPGNLAPDGSTPLILVEPGWYVDIPINLRVFKVFTGMYLNIGTSEDPVSILTVDGNTLGLGSVTYGNDILNTYAESTILYLTMTEGTGYVFGIPDGEAFLVLKLRKKVSR